MKKDDCIFCKLANGDIPVNALYEDDVLKVIFDAGPATRGHVLIIPKNHFDNIYDLDDDTAAHVAQTAVKIAKAMKKALGYEGLNVVQNNGLAAGQTVFHYHVHMIPRYKNDKVQVTWKQHEVSADEIAELKAAILGAMEDGQQEG